MLLAHLVFALVPLLSPGLFPKTQPHDLATWPGRADRVFVWLVWPPFFVTGVLTWAIVTPGLVASWWHLRRLSVARVAVWGALMGAWAALLFFASPVVTTARLLGNVGVGDGLLELAVRGALHLVVVPVVFALIAGLGARDRTR
jgi:hypothetical protein